jgi:hypothetical protein
MKMKLERARKELELQHRRISSQVSLISQLRNNGHFQESERACRTLEGMLDWQTHLYKELWRAQGEPPCGSPEVDEVTHDGPSLERAI